jgi:DNA-binding winged helix-turn-helix (wHTH) protein
MPVLAFGPFRLDTRALELRRDGRRVRMRPQPCRLLVALVSRPGELVTRDELRAELWPDGVFVRFDLGLNSCLKQVRAALGESAGAPRYIETLSRRGYRFGGQVAVEPARPWIPGNAIGTGPSDAGVVVSYTEEETG